MYITTTVRFTEVPVQAVRNLKCACGRRFRRQRTFIHTVNPFNRNADGQPKTYGEVWRDVKAEAEAWSPDPTCNRCKTN